LKKTQKTRKLLLQLVGIRKTADPEIDPRRYHWMQRSTSWGSAIYSYNEEQKWIFPSVSIEWRNGQWMLSMRRQQHEQ